MRDKNLPKNMDWKQLARYFAGETSEEENKQMKALLEESSEIREYVRTLQQMRERARLRGEQWDIEAEWANLAQQSGITQQPPAPSTRPSAPALRASADRLTFDLRPPTSVLHFPFRQIFRIAAAVVLLIGVPYLVYNFRDSLFGHSTQQLAMREVKTERGQRVRLEFADGSTVLLNASSSISFPERFTNGNREVRLQGEAFFDVTHLKDSPFIVHAGDANVQVLGTRFNVRAWSDDRNVEVVLEEGRVAVSSEKWPAVNGVLLDVGQKTIVAAGETPTVPEQVDLDKHLAWLEGKLVFEKTAFRDVVKQLQRTYDINCQIEDSTLLPHRLTATFTKEQSLNEIFKSLSIALNTEFTQSGGSVTFGTGLNPRP